MMTKLFSLITLTLSLQITAHAQLKDPAVRIQIVEGNNSTDYETTATSANPNDLQKIQNLLADPAHGVALRSMKASIKSLTVGEKILQLNKFPNVVGTRVDFNVIVNSYIGVNFITISKINGINVENSRYITECWTDGLHRCTNTFSRRLLSEIDAIIQENKKIEEQNELRKKLILESATEVKDYSHTPSQNSSQNGI